MQTAKLLCPDLEPKACQMLDPDADLNFPAWCKVFSELQSENKHIIAIVGHHPGVANLLRQVVNFDCRRIGFGEAIVVSGSLDEIIRGCGNVERVLPPKDTSELLRKKIELKMTVCTFLAGFTIPVLVELLKDSTDNAELWRIVTTICFTFSLAFFVAAIFAFDLLLMPSEFWGPIATELKPEETRRDEFAVNYRLNGAIYAYMIRTWKWFFMGGLAFILPGFVGLIMKSYLSARLSPELGAAILSIGTLGALVIVFLLFRKGGPKLGIED